MFLECTWVQGGYWQRCKTVMVNEFGKTTVCTVVPVTDGGGSCTSWCCFPELAGWMYTWTPVHLAWCGRGHRPCLKSTAQHQQSLSGLHPARTHTVVWGLFLFLSCRLCLVRLVSVYLHPDLLNTFVLIISATFDHLFFLSCSLPRILTVPKIYESWSHGWESVTVRDFLCWFLLSNWNSPNKQLLSRSPVS